MQAAEVTATQDGEVMNEMATVSARAFTVEETDRYAGSRGDPARMASNFAGVQGADDSRNDIVVRGNSPTGVLWRVEGVDLPNPNHFSVPGTGGDLWPSSTTRRLPTRISSLRRSRQNSGTAQPPSSICASATETKTNGTAAPSLAFSAQRCWPKGR